MSGAAANSAAPVWTRALLIAGVVAPIGYYLLQFAAAQLYPGYDFRHQVASELGVAGHASAAVFNAGVFLLGVFYAAAAIGVFVALRRERTPTILAVLLMLCLLSHALGAFNAAIFPLPDPRHNPGLMQAGVFLLPLIAPITWLFIKRAPRAKATLWGALLCIALIAPIMSGLTPIDPRAEGGAWQRVVAFVFNLPVFIVCVSLLARPGETGPA